MTGGDVTYVGGPIFDGSVMRIGQAARFRGGRLVDLCPADRVEGPDIVALNGDILSHGFVDLQVNGGGGVMLNDDPSSETLRRIAEAHRKLGTVRLLPTLITDTADKTRAAISATIKAIEAGIPGIAGLHLEGPHLSVARKGAHDAAYIRPMTSEDMASVIAAARDIPILKVTLAPESVRADQVAALRAAGVLVSLGHSDAAFETCIDYARAGASCVTHLFNAMSQMGNRTPGLVGAALADGGVSAGLIADGIHVHPATMRAAWAAKTGPGKIYLVSDAMAVAGTDLTEFHLDGRCIRRQDRRLTLEDGTLAGADLDLTTAVRTLVQSVGVTVEDALAAATTVPAALIGQKTDPSNWVMQDLIRIAPDLSAARPLVDPN